FNTVLKTPDNKTVILPNAPISTGAVVNYSTEAQRRVDMMFGIGYEDDIDAARSALEELIQKDTRILKEPAPQIVVAELADSSVNFKVRAWVVAADYWGVFFDMQEQVKKTFDARKISIPFPQMQVHTE
ncbi:MAG: mechanosensitive ion channel family protein, partial [Flavobacteriales bacterium]